MVSQEFVIDAKLIPATVVAEVVAEVVTEVVTGVVLKVVVTANKKSML